MAGYADLASYEEAALAAGAAEDEVRVLGEGCLVWVGVDGGICGGDHPHIHTTTHNTNNRPSSPPLPPPPSPPPNNNRTVLPPSPTSAPRSPRPPRARCWPHGRMTFPSPTTSTTRPPGRGSWGMTRLVCLVWLGKGRWIRRDDGGAAHVHHHHTTPQNNDMTLSHSPPSHVTNQRQPHNRRGSRWGRRRFSRTSCRTTPTAPSRWRRTRTRACPRPRSTPARYVLYVCVIVFGLVFDRLDSFSHPIYIYHQHSTPT